MTGRRFEPGRNLAAIAVMVAIAATTALDSAGAAPVVAPAPVSPSAAAPDAITAMARAYDAAIAAQIDGDERTAEAHYREVIAYAEAGLVRDARYAVSCVELAMLSARHGDLDEAIRLMTTAQATRSELLGAEHPDAVETRLMLRELERQAHTVATVPVPDASLAAR